MTTKRTRIPDSICEPLASLKGTAGVSAPHDIPTDRQVYQPDHTRIEPQAQAEPAYEFWGFATAPA